MDFTKAVRELMEEKERLDRAIACLEGLAVQKPAARRGRKTMDEEERKIVSERMKRYWATERKKKNA